MGYLGRKLGVFITAAVLLTVPYAANRSFAEVQRLVKIGYVDVERVFDRYPGTDDIRERLRVEKERYEAEINKRKEEIARLELEYQQNYSRMTADERMRRESEISYKKELLAEYIEQANASLDALKQTLTEPIYLKIISVIQKVSAEKGYSFVFRKSSQTILYYDREFDITEDVITRLLRELSIQERN